MALLPSDVQNALKRQAPKALRRDLEKEAKRKFKENQGRNDKGIPLTPRDSRNYGGAECP